VQSDPIGLAGGINLYGYVEANPLRYSDPQGLFHSGLMPAVGIGRNPDGSPGIVGPGIPWGPPAVPDTRWAAANDMWRNYREMREANTIDADRYFHCKANCEAARRGPVGACTAQWISDGREWWDQNVKGSPRSDSIIDQIANHQGRRGGSGTNNQCELVCSGFRPRGLPSRY
jgi:hypothetical protein